MTIIAKTTTAAIAALMGFAVLTTSATTEAQAGDRAAAAAIGGFAVGTLFGAAAAQPRYYEPAPVVVYERPVYRGRVTPAGVSVRHARNCAARYRSYDWETNTWIDLRGRVRVCR